MRLQTLSPPPQTLTAAGRSQGGSIFLMLVSSSLRIYRNDIYAGRPPARGKGGERRTYYKKDQPAALASRAASNSRTKLS